MLEWDPMETWSKLLNRFLIHQNGYACSHARSQLWGTEISTSLIILELIIKLETKYICVKHLPNFAIFQTLAIALRTLFRLVI